MARHFFTGGMMPSRDLLTRCSGPLEVQQQWTVSGEDYARTATAWLKNLDGSRREAERVLQRAGALDSRRELERWRLFFMACAELFGFADGDEWFVVHHRRSDSPVAAPTHQSNPNRAPQHRSANRKHSCSILFVKIPLLRS